MSKTGVELKKKKKKSEFTVSHSRCPQILEFDHFTLIVVLYITAIVGVCA